MSNAGTIITAYKAITDLLSELSDEDARSVLEVITVERGGFTVRAESVAETHTAAPVKVESARTITLDDDPAITSIGGHGCLFCGETGIRQLGRHVRNEHGEEVEEELAATGYRGLMQLFGLSEGTAYSIAKLVEAAA
jgi:hypothetical protein